MWRFIQSCSKWRSNQDVWHYICVDTEANSAGYLLGSKSQLHPINSQKLNSFHDMR